jgi:hypothetical protein
LTEDEDPIALSMTHQRQQHYVHRPSGLAVSDTRLDALIDKGTGRVSL